MNVHLSISVDILKCFSLYWSPPISIYLFKGNSGNTRIMMLFYFLSCSLLTDFRQCYYVKSVPIRSYSGPHSVRMRENTDQNNSENGHFLRNIFWCFHCWLWKKKCLLGWHYVQKLKPLVVFCKKGVLRNFAKFTGKHLCQSLFFHKAVWYLGSWRDQSCQNQSL